MQWLCLGLALTCAGTMVGQSYRDNARLFFYLGLLACVTLFFLIKQWLGPWAPGQIFLNTLILFRPGYLWNRPGDPPIASGDGNLSGPAAFLLRRGAT